MCPHSSISLTNSNHNQSSCNNDNDSSSSQENDSSQNDSHVRDISFDSECSCQSTNTATTGTCSNTRSNTRSNISSRCLSPSRNVSTSSISSSSVKIPLLGTNTSKYLQGHYFFSWFFIKNDNSTYKKQSNLYSFSISSLRKNRYCLYIAVPIYLIIFFLFMHSNLLSYHTTVQEKHSILKDISLQNNLKVNTKMRRKNNKQRETETIPTKDYYRNVLIAIASPNSRIATNSKIDETSAKTSIQILNRMKDRKTRTTIPPISTQQSESLSSTNFNTYMIQPSTMQTVDNILSVLRKQDTSSDSVDDDDASRRNRNKRRSMKRSSSKLKSTATTTTRNRDTKSRLDDRKIASSSTVLCGSFAQSGSIINPTSFTDQDSLLQEKKKNSVRVLITGIVSTPIGYNLATVLSQQCNVTVLIGFDTLYPNTVVDRLQYQEQIGIVTKITSKLVKPIFIGHVGIDPLQHPSHFRTSSSNNTTIGISNEVNIIQTFQPTHIVHMSYHNSDHSYDPYQHSKVINDQSPYTQYNNNVHNQNNDDNNSNNNNYNEEIPSRRNPSVFPIRNGMISMEQILAAIANTPLKDRPHFIYASSYQIESLSASTSIPKNNKLHQYGTSVHNHGRKIDEVLADYYYRQYGVYSVGVRIPVVYGPWEHPSSPIYQLLREQVVYHQQRKSNEAKEDVVIERTFDANTVVDLIHVHDVVDALVGIMQYRPSVTTDTSKNNNSNTGCASMILQLDATTQGISMGTIQQVARNILSVPINEGTSVTDALHRFAIENNIRTRNVTRTGHLEQLFGSSSSESSIDFMYGLANTLSWHLDRVQPYGPSPQVDEITLDSSDATAQKKKMNTIPIGSKAILSKITCSQDDNLCHNGNHQHALPCASECMLHKPKECIPSAFDDVLELSHHLSKQCDVVLYTQILNIESSTLSFDADVGTTGSSSSSSSSSTKPTDPTSSVCNFLYINQNSIIATKLLKEIPRKEIKKYDILSTKNLSQDDYTKINGQLTSHGWKLIFVKNSSTLMNTVEKSLLKLSPGRFFAPNVKEAVFVEQNCKNPPTSINDVLFLSNQMNRLYQDARVVQWESDIVQYSWSKGNVIVPPEPPRRAALFVSQLKYQNSSNFTPLPPNSTISSSEAVHYMMYDIGEDSLPTSSVVGMSMRLQREYYDRIKHYTNPNTARHLEAPNINFILSKWVSTQWVVHDLTNDDSRIQIRCPWYKEHSHWETPIDQLSLLYVLEKMDLERRLEENDLDDAGRRRVYESSRLKRSLSDAFEWIPLKSASMTTTNTSIVDIVPVEQHYSPYLHNVQVLPYDMEYNTDRLDQMMSSPILESIANSKDADPLLFVRIISDDIFSKEREEWDHDKA